MNVQLLGQRVDQRDGLGVCVQVKRVLVCVEESKEGGGCYNAARMSRRVCWNAGSWIRNLWRLPAATCAESPKAPRQLCCVTAALSCTALHGTQWEFTKSEADEHCSVCVSMCGAGAQRQTPPHQGGVSECALDRCQWR